MAGRRKIHIGTSGWHYPHWKGPFYPDDLAQETFLSWYAERFHTAEINNTFYQLPSEQTLAHWRDTVPKDFIFAVKASRYITHMKKLKDPEESLRLFLECTKVLGEKLGPILFQLPPHWKCNPQRLREFLETLPQAHRYAFEFRDESWFSTPILEALADFGAAFCIYELDRRLTPREVTTDFVYIRLHGPEGPYQGNYDPQTLAGWAGAFTSWTDQGKEIYCYFDNDEAGYAARNALRLQEMLEER